MNYLLDEDYHSLTPLGNHLSICWEILIIFFDEKVASFDLVGEIPNSCRRKNGHLSIMSRNSHFLKKRTARRPSGECEIDYLIRIRSSSVALWENLDWGIPKVNKLSL